ncbi:hypothetical protein BC826DRAFT_1177137 [Russula brevipes]|nr:hypothetical protein BC826DRAFT_1177137 [Russula brevipes]
MAMARKAASYGLRQRNRVSPLTRLGNKSGREEKRRSTGRDGIWGPAPSLVARRGEGFLLRDWMGVVVRRSREEAEAATAASWTRGMIRGQHDQSRSIIRLTRATTKVLVRRIHIHNQPRDYRNTPDDRFSLVNLKPKGKWSESDREGKGREGKPQILVPSNHPSSPRALDDAHTIASIISNAVMPTSSAKDDATDSEGVQWTNQRLQNTP